MPRRVGAGNGEARLTVRSISAMTSGAWRGAHAAQAVNFDVQHADGVELRWQFALVDALRIQAIQMRGAVLAVSQGRIGRRAARRTLARGKRPRHLAACRQRWLRRRAACAHHRCQRCAQKFCQPETRDSGLGLKWDSRHDGDSCGGGEDSNATTKEAGCKVFLSARPFCPQWLVLLYQ